MCRCQVVEVMVGGARTDVCGATGLEGLLGFDGREGERKKKIKAPFDRDSR